MKRILLLIVLVMLAAHFLRSHEERPHYRGFAEAPRSHRHHKSRPRSHVKEPQRKVVEAEWVEADAPAAVGSATRTISSGLMATEDRAKADAIHKLEQTLSEWLEPEIPTDWKPSKKLVRSMIREVTYTPVVKDYGTLYVAELTADTSSQRRDAIVAEYQRQTVHHRMLALGGSLAFVLVCLGIVSGYIRADEATRGYYTNRLRMLAAAGVGAAGVAVYRFMV